MRKEKETKNEFEKERKKHPIKKAIITLFLSFIIFLILYFYISLINWKSLSNYMLINTPSIVLDSSGNEIAYIGNERIRENVTIADIPDNLKNAYVAIEDERFYKHFGIDIKRTAHAIFSYIIHFGKSSFGGSTITQQLVKNITGENSTTISRKISEWIKAIELETFLSKDKILEAYFNIIYTGPNIYGVQSASKYYFGKDVKELSLAECSFLAGINISPNSFNPFGEKNNSEKITKRIQIVLRKMKELNYITEEEYNKAIEESANLSFEKFDFETTNTNYSYHTDATIDEIISDFTKHKGVSKNFATNYFKLSGCIIQSTQNSEIQSTVEEEFRKSQYILKSKNIPDETSQAAMIIMEPSSGKILACVGGLGEKNTFRGFNRATSAIRQTGSAGKPISVLIPAFCTNKITASSIFVDIETTFDDGTENGYTPEDYNGYKGAITLRRAIESSQNIPFVKIMEKISPSTSISYMKKIGISTLTSNDNNLNLALGGLDKGISPLEMAGSYNTISNNGLYIEPTFYETIKDNSGKIIFSSKQKKRKIFSKEIAYILKELLTQPVNGVYGTATYCKIPGIETSAKTGTTNDNYDRWLCGFTPYYTAVTWYGFDMSETIEFDGKNPAGIIWANVMKKIHSNLENKNFEKPQNILEIKICPTSRKSCKFFLL